MDNIYLIEWIIGVVIKKSRNKFDAMKHYGDSKVAEFSNTIFPNYPLLMTYLTVI